MKDAMLKHVHNNHFIAIIICSLLSADLKVMLAISIGQYNVS